MSNEVNFSAPFDGGIEEIITLIKFHREEEALAIKAKQDSLTLGSETSIFPTNVEKDMILMAGKDDRLMAEYWKSVLKNREKVELAKVGINISAEPLVILDAPNTSASKTEPVVVKENVATKETVEDKKETEGTVVGETKEEKYAPRQDVQMAVVHSKLGTDAPEEKAAVIDVPDTIKEEIYGLYLTKGGGTKIEGDITDEDRKNPHIVIETREEGKVETKRHASSKEKAAFKYREFMTSMGRDMSEDVIKLADIKHEVEALVNAFKPIMQKKVKDELLANYAKLALVTERASISKTLAAKDIIALKAFDINMLTGDLKAKDVKSEDLLKLKAISLAANGKFKDAVNAVNTEFKDVEGMNVQIASLFVSNLMGRDPYIEMDNLLTTLLTDDKSKHLQHEATMMMLVKGFTGWNDKKATKHINNYIDGLKQTSGLPVSCELIGGIEESNVNTNVNTNADKPVDEVKKVEADAKANLKSNGKKKKSNSKKQTEKTPTATAEKKDEPAKVVEPKKTEETKETPSTEEKPNKDAGVETKPAEDDKSDAGKDNKEVKPTGDPVPGEQDSTTGSENGEDTTKKEPAKTETGIPTLKCVHKATKDKKTYKGGVEEDGVMFKYIARVNKKKTLEQEVQDKFNNYASRAAKDDKLKMPKGLEGYKKGDVIKIEFTEVAAAS